MKVAVITPCFNNEAYIADCIKSVQAAKTFDLFEIEHFVVDDASTDASWDKISQLHYPNLKTFRLKTNQGPSAARNFAISQSSAEYIFCLDADDVLFQNSLHYLVTGLIKRHAEWVYGDFLRGNQQLGYEIANDYYGSQFASPQQVLAKMYAGNHFFQHSSLFTRNLFERAGKYHEDVRMAEDFDLFTRFLISGALPHYAGGALFMHRNHAANASIKHRDDSNLHKNDIAAFYKKYEAELSKRGITLDGRCE